MKDLEIRGAGSILGAEQSGHIAGVGFDLYVRLVGEAVTAFKKAAGAAGGGGRRGGAGSRSGSNCRSTPTSRTTTSRPNGCGWTPTGGSPAACRTTTTWPRCGRSCSTGSGRCPSRSKPARGGRVPAAVPSLGVTEVTLGANGLRFSPIELPESGRMRLTRLYRGAEYREASRDGDAAAADRVGLDRFAGAPGRRAAGVLPGSADRIGARTR